MKKLILLVVITLLSVSCTRETIIFDGATVDVQYITVNPRDWVPEYLFSDTDEGFASATFRMDMITSAVINRGAVLCYFVGSDNVETPLPFILTQVDGDFIFTNTLSFDVTTRSIRFISENSDLFIEMPNRSMTIKVVTIVNR